MSHITECMAEQEALGWFEELGYEVVSGPDMAPDGPSPERKTYKQVILEGRLRSSLHRLNPELPPAAIDDAVGVVMTGGTPGLFAGNHEFHRMLTLGVQVYWQQDGETKGRRRQFAHRSSERSYASFKTRS